VLHELQAVSTLARYCPAARQGNQMIAREAFAVPQLLLGAPAELAPIAVAGEQERVGHLAAEPARDVHELDQTDDRGPRQRQPLAAHGGALRLHDLGLAVDHQTQRAAHGHHGQGLERRVERETAHACSSPAKKGRPRPPRARRPRILTGRGNS
jgi:hypothetical protein